jgi:hypothetical protein
MKVVVASKLMRTLLLILPTCLWRTCAQPSCTVIPLDEPPLLNTCPVLNTKKADPRKAKVKTGQEVYGHDTSDDDSDDDLNEKSDDDAIGKSDEGLVTK